MKKELEKIAKKYNIKMIILFGSQAKNRARKESDVDLAIHLGKKISLQKELTLRADLFQVFQKEIDIAFLENAGALLLGEIAQNGKLLYGNKTEFTKFCIYAMKRYLDFEPYFRLQEQVIRKKISKIHA